MDIENQVDETTEINETESIGQNSNLEELQEQLNKKTQAFQDQKRRAEIAESKLKEYSSKTPSPKTEVDSSITARDVLALTQAGVTNDEDISILEQFAKVKNVTLREIVKDRSAMAYLKNEQELRTTNNATSTGQDRRGTDIKDISVLSSDAEKGILPDSKDDLRKLIRHKMGLK